MKAYTTLYKNNQVLECIVYVVDDSADMRISNFAIKYHLENEKNRETVLVCSKVVL